MTLWTRLPSWAQGFVGALVAMGLAFSGWWVYQRYVEFTIMRADIVFIHPQIEQARRQAAPPVQPPAPTPAPTVPAK